jgi:hypothetical protein
MVSPPAPAAFHPDPLQAPVLRQQSLNRGDVTAADGKQQLYRDRVITGQRHGGRIAVHNPIMTRVVAALASFPQPGGAVSAGAGEQGPVRAERPSYP